MRPNRIKSCVFLIFFFFFDPTKKFNEYSVFIKFNFKISSLHRQSFPDQLIMYYDNLSCY